MRYTVYLPSPPLATSVARYWVMEADRPPLTLRHRIVPNGRCKLLFNYGSDFLCQYNHAEPDRLRHGSVVGQMDRPAFVQPTGRIGVFGIELHPAGARAILRLPLGELEGRLAGVRDLLRTAWCRELDERLRASRTDQERREHVERALITQLRPEFSVDATVSRALHLLARGDSIASIVADSGLSTSTFERRFKNSVGASARRFARIGRLQAILRDVRHSPGKAWVQAALDAGYYDQAHLIKDFRALIGCTPLEYFAEESAIAAAFAGVRL